MRDIALKMLLHDRLRFLITVSGVAFAVTLVFVQVGLFLGLVSNASTTIEHCSADLWITSRNTANIDFAQTFPDTLVNRVRSISGVSQADNLIVWFMRLTLPTGATEGMLTYALEDYSRWNLPWNLADGHLRDLRRGNFFVLDESGTRRYGAFYSGEFREVIGRRLKIIGRTQEATSFTTTPIAFLDFHLAQRLDPQGLAGKTTYILVKLAPGANIAAVREEIRRRLPFNDVYTKAEWAERSRRYWIDSTGIGLNMYTTVFLGCLVGVVVVAQTLYTSAMEHFNEFATVKAIGGCNSDIYRILVKQAVVAGLLGYIIGAGLAQAVKPVMARMALKLLVPPELFGLVLGGTVLLCIAAALVSFRKIASLEPAMVFRT